MPTTLPVFDLRTHRGAILFSEQVTAYLTKEMSLGRVAGPFDTVPFHGRSQDFSKGGHTDSYRGYSSDCHLNIVSCLLTRRLTKGGGGSRAPQDLPSPLATPMHSPMALWFRLLIPCPNGTRMNEELLSI